MRASRHVEPRLLQHLARRRRHVWLAPLGRAADALPEATEALDRAQEQKLRTRPVDVDQHLPRDTQPRRGPSEPGTAGLQPYAQVAAGEMNRDVAVAVG